jgi:acyl dehydratase
VGTYDDLRIGDRFTTPSRAFTGKDLASLISIGGYTHPLFTDPDFAAASPFGATPAPGQALLLLMGGLAEQSGRFDETTIGLVGLTDVTFAKAAFAGDTLRIEIEVVDKKQSASGRRGSVTMRWTCVNASNEALAEATATMLFRCD